MSYVSTLLPPSEDDSPVKEPASVDCDSPAEAAVSSAALKVVLDILRAKIGYDFSCYKASSLVRRIRRRMTLGKIATIAEYSEHLLGHSDEVVLLKKDLLIGVTEFFRQPEAWKILAEKVLPVLIERNPPEAELRIWTPGCSTGKEAYSLAILLVEHAESSGKKIGFKIFATDPDVDALAIGRGGSYPEAELGKTITPERLKRFFVRKEGYCQVIKEVREKLIFAPQNITADPPFSQLDLISCRNLLIYLDPEVQKKIIALFHFALRDGGLQLLGTAVTIGDREDLFTAVSKRWRIYRRIGSGRSAGVEIPLRPLGGCLPEASERGKQDAVAAPRMSLTSAAHQILVDRFAPACVMINRRLQVLYVHGAVEDYLTFPPGELTTRVVDMAREGLRSRLRGAISKCLDGNRAVSVIGRVRRGGKSAPVKAKVSPVRLPREADGLLLITFEDYQAAIPREQSQGEAEYDLHQLRDELKITREELQSTIEQFAGSNDELKALNEEVTATNEELQSANEELETSKEELQSLNEELNTINARLQEKVLELESVNNDLLNLLSSTSIATIFLDKELRVRRYTPASTHLFSLIHSDLGRPISDVLRRFHDDELLADVSRVLAELTPAVKEVQADDGRWYYRRITPYRTQSDRIEGVVITFSDVSELKQSEQSLRRFTSTVPVGVMRYRMNGDIIEANDRFLEMLGYSRTELIAGQLRWTDLTPEESREADAAAHEEVIAAGCHQPYEKFYRHKNGTLVPIILASVRVNEAANEGISFVLDLSERKRAELALRDAHERATWLARFPDENPNPIMRVASDGRVLYCNRAVEKLPGWLHHVGEALSAALQPLFKLAMAQAQPLEQDVQLDQTPYAVTVVPIPAENYANIYARDVSERKRAEQELQQLNASLELCVADQTAEIRKTYELLNGIMSGTDDKIAAADTDFRYTSFNQAYRDEVKRLYGTDIELGANVVEAMARLPEDSMKAEALWRRALQGEIFTIEQEFGDPDRQRNWYQLHFFPIRDHQNQVSGVAHITRDITARRLAEEAVKAERQRLHDVLDLLPAYVILLTPDYRVPFANRFFEERFGASHGRRCHDYLFNRTEPCEICETFNVLKTNAPHRWEWTGPDGRDYDIFDFPYTDSDGAHLIMEVGLDVTEAKRATRALNEANEKLEERVAQRTAELAASETRLRQTQEILETVTMGTSVIIAAIDTQHRYLYFSRTYRDEIKRLTGKDLQLGDSMKELFEHLPEQLEAVLQEWRQPLEGETTNKTLEFGDVQRYHRIYNVLHTPIRDDRGVVVGAGEIAYDMTEQMRTQEALRESEERFSSFMTHNPAAAWIVDEGGRFRYASPGYYRNFRVAGDVIDKKINDVHDEQRTARYLSVNRIVLEERRVVETIESGPRADGSLGSYLVVKFPMTGSRGETLLGGIALDITESRRAEEAVRVSETRFKLLSETAGQLLATTDPQRLISELCRDVMTHLDCQFFFNFLVDDEADRLNLNAYAGISPEEALKIRWLDYGAAVCGEVARDLKRFICENVQQSSDPRLERIKSYGVQAYCCHPLMAHGRLIGTLSFGAKTRTAFSPEDLALMKTVSDQAAAAMDRMGLIEALHSSKDQLELRVQERTAELAEANQLLRREVAERLRLIAAVEQAGEGIAITDPAGIIDYINPAFAALGGLARPDLIGKNCLLVLAGDQADESLKRDVAQAIGSSGTWTGRISRKLPDSRASELDVAFSPLRDPSGLVTNYLAVVRDASQEVRLEQHVRQMQKIEALGTLAGGIAHDFNNILSPILINSELVMNEFAQDSTAHQLLQQTLQAAQRGRDLVKRIIAFSRQKETQRTPLKAGPLVKEALDLLRASLPSTIEIREQLQHETGCILSDPAQIHQIVMNLCNNAAYAMRERGGVLEVSLAEVEVDAEMLRRRLDLKPGPYLRLTVADTGAGMTPAVLERIFDPFFTTKKPGEGSGMGLAVVHGIVRNHDGAVNVYSEAGIGSTFQIFLPRRPMPAAVPPRPLMSPIARGHESILVVDDEELQAESVRMMLARLGYKVVKQTDSSVALALFQENPQAFDLVITDQTMPQLTGAMLAQALLRLRPDLPIILCTGFSELIEAEEARAMGISEFLMKPFAIREIAESVRKALDKQKK